MPKYSFTEKASPIVAGHNNTGVGTTVVLTKEQAAAAVKAGELIETDKAVKASREARAKAEEADKK